MGKVYNVATKIEQACRQEILQIEEHKQHFRHFGFSEEAINEIVEEAKKRAMESSNTFIDEFLNIVPLPIVDNYISNEQVEKLKDFSFSLKTDKHIRKTKPTYNLTTDTVRSGMDYSSFYENKSLKFPKKIKAKWRISKQARKTIKATKILQRVNKKYALKLNDDEIRFIVDSAYFGKE